MPVLQVEHAAKIHPPSRCASCLREPKWEEIWMRQVASGRSIDVSPTYMSHWAGELSAAVTRTHETAETQTGQDIPWTRRWCSPRGCAGSAAEFSCARPGPCPRGCTTCRASLRTPANPSQTENVSGLRHTTDAARRTSSANTLSEKNCTTSMSAFVDVTPCCVVLPRVATAVRR